MDAQLAGAVALHLRASADGRSECGPVETQKIEGEPWIILDQPEDDLDNRLIYDLIVRQLRNIKSKRQVIVVTHNANIVVNGDAEFVLALDSAGGQTQQVASGSLQDAGLRSEICKIMEGGREAFHRRYRRISLTGL